MMNSSSHVGTVIIIYSLLFDFSLTCDNNTCILLFIINISRMFSKVTKHNLLDLSKIQLIGNAVQFLSPMLSYHLELFLRRRQCSMQLVRSILAKYMKNNNKKLYTIVRTFDDTLIFVMIKSIMCNTHLKHTGCVQSMYWNDVIKAQEQKKKTPNQNSELVDVGNSLRFKSWLGKK